MRLFLCAGAVFWRAGVQLLQFLEYQVMYASLNQRLLIARCNMRTRLPTFQADCVAGATDATRLKASAWSHTVHKYVYGVVVELCKPAQHE